MPLCEDSGSPDPRHPAELSEAAAVERAWHGDIAAIGAFLRARLSVLVTCDKIAVPHLWPAIVRHTGGRAATGGESAGKVARLEAVVLEIPAHQEEAGPLAGSRAQQQLDYFRKLIADLKPDQVLVVPHLDLLAGGGDRNPGREARELIELLYRDADRLLLAFADPALPIPETLAARFAVHVSVSGLPREVRLEDGSLVPLGVGLVTAPQSGLFAGYDPASVFKSVAGLNPVRLRDALAYAVQVALDRGYSPRKPAKLGLLLEQIRAFKAQGSEQFEIPETSFDDIGGYDDVKATLRRALGLLQGAGALPDDALRRELVPKGFLFHGPPGTGKTLLAKAIAHDLNGTIRVVSGPEITDKYVGESERKVRELFAEARRNAPSVLVFDEFDAIASKRSGRDDGGSRAGNAIVAQILTEMDGFRPDVPMLVIGTTNQLSLIDEALLRPSRFQPVRIGLPTPAARRRIAELHAQHFAIPARGVALEPELLELIAGATDQMNGDEIRSIFRDACVQHYCEGVAIDAWRLGFLVGRVRAGRDEQRSDKREPPQPDATGRRRPSPHVRRRAEEAPGEDAGPDSPSPDPRPQP